MVRSRSGRQSEWKENQKIIMTTIKEFEQYSEGNGFIGTEKKIRVHRY